ncbi:hypothetical protein DBR40_20805 [Pedobacter sp. KBW01]|nr:hypothetical protein DBR40_20805 [Pedobacter sp. KBW01]
MLNLLFTLLLYSCSNSSAGNQLSINQIMESDGASGINDSYVATGFYFLADEGQGIKMKKDHSTEYYHISKKPFASITNILRATVQKNVIDQNETYGVVIVFDNKGTKDLEEGTGNDKYPYIAVVIANRLMYVIENKSKIKTGVMNIYLQDYSEKEVGDMIDSINKKK